MKDLNLNFTDSSLVLSVAPATEPITTAEAKAQARVDISDDDTYIDTLITAARVQAETYTQRAFIDQTWVYKIDEWPSGVVQLPRAPLSSVTSIAYLDADGNSQTLSSSVYTVDTSSEPGRIYLADGQTWPTVQSVRHPITITYVAGYGSAASSVPAPIKAAIKVMVATWYENRESAIIGTITANIGSGIGSGSMVEGMLNPYRLRVI